MKYKPCPAFGLCLDWETSGANWGYTPAQQAKDFQGITFGAVIYDTKTLLPVETLYREMKFDHNKYQWTSGAEAVHGKSMAYLGSHGVDRLDAALDLIEMTMKYFSNTPVPFMGHNRDFDMAFTKQLFVDTGVPEFSYHHTNIDSSGIAFTLLNIYKSNDVFDFLGLAERKEHNALEDALMTLESCRRIKLLVQTALGN